MAFPQQEDPSVCSCRVIEGQLVSGLNQRFETFLVPQLRDVEGARILDIASARCATRCEGS